MALGSFGPDLTKAMIQQVGAALKDTDRAVRHAAALSLGNFGPASKAALPEIRAAVKDSLALGPPRGGLRAREPGTAAKAAVPELIGALSDANETVRHAAALCPGKRRRGGEGRRRRAGQGPAQRPRPRRSPVGGFRPGRDRF